MSSRADPTLPRPTRWPWVVLAVFVSIAVVGMVLVRLNDESLLEQVPYVVAFLMFGIVGATIVSRDRANRIGLMLLFGSTITALSFMGGEFTTWLLVRGHRGPFVVATAFLNNLGWLFGILPVIFLLPLLFPDGRLPSPRWRPFLWFIVTFESLLFLFVVFGSKRLTGSNDAIGVANPLFVRALDGLPSLDRVFGVPYIGIFAASVVSVFVRFRGASGIERQQIKWVAFGLVVAFAAIVFTGFVASEGLVSQVVGGAGYLVFPVSIGIAVLRFHLYDLDVVVRKAFVYGTLAIFATLVYLGLVVGLGTALGRGSSFLTMVAAVLVAVTFQPARQRIARVADRLVYGRRATPYEVLTEFSGRVGEAYATDDVLGRMAQILGQGVGAATARVWLLVGGRLRPASSWPAGDSTATELALTGGALPEIPGELAVEVRDRGELLGALSVATPANDPMTPAKERLVRDLASQAGLALRNVRLVEELKASQRRIVAAQDLERRRIERNIHDGAQQQLVALAVKMRLAGSLATKDGEKAAAMLEQMLAETQTALENLRDLARGIYPPLLADKGLPAAIEAQARKSSVPVDVSPDGVERYQAEVEAAVYFSVLEALQNAAKYAAATRVSVRLGDDRDWLTFEVEDDGRGFDPSATGYGTGLQGIADRLAALDGVVEIRSRPGEGTVIAGRIPRGSAVPR